jgi:peptide/nickel transport system ATP-binding protein
VQRQILDQLTKLVEDERLTLLLITHDLPIALERSDRVAVMSAGKVVDVRDSGFLELSTTSAYTQRLFESAPSMRTSKLINAVAPNLEPPLLAANGLAKHFHGQERPAVDDVSLAIWRGRTLAVVGESGSGKTTTARIVGQLEVPDRGDVLLDGQPVVAASRHGLAAFRSRVQFVFQNPYSSLDPRMTIEDALFEPLRLHKAAPRRERHNRVSSLLEQVALPSSFASRKPHELSGGQLQRVAIARALALTPDLIVCDEPVSALDATVQGQILDLLADLQREHGISYLFISHDLSVVRLIAHDVVVMTEGRVVEAGPTEDVFAHPSHPYTRQLIASIPTSHAAANRSRTP